MTAKECLTGRRSIRNFKPDTISHELLNSIIETASYSPSWKNTQTVRYIAVEGDLKNQIATECYSIFPGNSHTAENAPMLIVLTAIKGRCGFERDGSFSTSKKDSWQMFDAGIAAQTFCLAAWEQGLGSVIQGLYDEEKAWMICYCISNDQSKGKLFSLRFSMYGKTFKIRKRRKCNETLNEPTGFFHRRTGKTLRSCR